MNLGLMLCAVALGSVADPQADSRLGELDYFWTISGSADTPHASGSLPWTGLRDVYVWFDCAYFDGVTRAQMELETNGLALISFTAMNGFVQGGVLPQLDLSHAECPTGPVIAGVLSVEDATGDGGWICAGPTRVLEDCQVVPGVHELGLYGFTTKGTSLPCNIEHCPVDFVMPYGWGKVKARYRSIGAR